MNLGRFKYQGLAVRKQKLEKHAGTLIKMPIFFSVARCTYSSHPVPRNLRKLIMCTRTPRRMKMSPSCHTLYIAMRLQRGRTGSGATNPRGSLTRVSAQHHQLLPPPGRARRGDLTSMAETPQTMRLSGEATHGDHSSHLRRHRCPQARC